MNLLSRAREGPDREFRPAGYNIGINDGAAAGQTIPHLHMHLIPRYPGDQLGGRSGWADSGIGIWAARAGDFLPSGDDAGRFRGNACNNPHPKPEPP